MVTLFANVTLEMYGKHVLTSVTNVNLVTHGKHVVTLMSICLSRKCVYMIQMRYPTFTVQSLHRMYERLCVTTMVM